MCLEQCHYAIHRDDFTTFCHICHVFRVGKIGNNSISVVKQQEKKKKNNQICIHTKPQIIWYELGKGVKLSNETPVLLWDPLHLGVIKQCVKGTKERGMGEREAERKKRRKG